VYGERVYGEWVYEWHHHLLLHCHYFGSTLFRRRPPLTKVPLHHPLIPGVTGPPTQALTASPSILLTWCHCTTHSPGVTGPPTQAVTESPSILLTWCYCTTHSPGVTAAPAILLTWCHCPPTHLVSLPTHMNTVVSTSRMWISSLSRSSDSKFEIAFLPSMLNTPPRNCACECMSV
jgi:hypothetical protein